MKHTQNLQVNRGKYTTGLLNSINENKYRLVYEYLYNGVFRVTNEVACKTDFSTVMYTATTTDGNKLLK
jgi:hypothetical protein